MKRNMVEMENKMDKHMNENRAHMKNNIDEIK
jgi:hypothetical protein